MNNKGIALVLVLLVILLLMVIVFEFSFAMKVEITATQNFKDETDCYFYAQSGFQQAVAEITKSHVFRDSGERTDTIIVNAKGLVSVVPFLPEEFSFGLDGDGEFLLQLADESRARRFTGFDLSPRKLPFQRVECCCFSLAGENKSFLNQNPDGDFLHYRKYEKRSSSPIFRTSRDWHGKYTRRIY